MGWKQYFGLEYVDYTDQVFKAVAKTRYAKRQFSLVIKMVIVHIVRCHIKLFLSLIFSVHPVVDFFVSILISVVLVFKSGLIENLVNRFQGEIYLLSRYLINEYTPNNLRVWKRNVTLGVCAYLLIYLYFVEVNSWMLAEYIVQFLLSYFIVDGIEQGTFVRFYVKCCEWLKSITFRCNKGTRLREGEIVIYDKYLDANPPTHNGYASEDNLSLQNLKDKDQSSEFGYKHDKHTSTLLYNLKDKDISHNLKDKDQSSEYDEYISEDGDECMKRSWMGLDNAVVVDRSPTHSLVIFDE